MVYHEDTKARRDGRKEAQKTQKGGGLRGGVLCKMAGDRRPDAAGGVAAWQSVLPVGEAVSFPISAIAAPMIGEENTAFGWEAGSFPYSGSVRDLCAFLRLFLRHPFSPSCLRAFVVNPDL